MLKPKEVSILVRIKLVANPLVDRDEIEQDVTKLLHDGPRWMLARQPNAVELLAADAPGDEGTLEKHFDLHALLNHQQQVAIIWGIDDVLVLRPDLTDAQAWEVLQHAQRNHDAEIGMNWYTIEAAATAVFGPAPKPQETSK